MVTVHMLKIKSVFKSSSEMFHAEKIYFFQQLDILNFHTLVLEGSVSPRKYDGIKALCTNN